METEEQSDKSSVTDRRARIAIFGMRSDWSGPIPTGPRTINSPASKVVCKEYVCSHLLLFITPLSYHHHLWHICHCRPGVSVPRLYFVLHITSDSAFFS